MFKKFLALLGFLIYSISLFGSAGKHALAQKALASATAVALQPQQRAVQWKQVSKQIFSICFSPDGKWAIGAGLDYTGDKVIVVFSIDPETGFFTEISKNAFYDVGDINFSSDGKYVIASVVYCKQAKYSSDGSYRDSEYHSSIDLFSLDEETGEIHKKETIEKWPRDNKPPKFIFSTAKRHLVTWLGSLIGIKAYDDKKQEYTYLTTKEAYSTILHAAYSSDGRYFAVVCENDTRTVKVEIFNARYESIDSFTMPKGLRMHTINYSPDGKKLMIMTGQSFVPVDMLDIDGKSGKVIRESLFQFNTGLIRDNASKYSVDGRYLFVRGVSRDNEVHKEQLLLAPVDSTGHPTMKVSEEQSKRLADVRVLSEEDYIRDFALLPQENILAVVTDQALKLYEFDDETGAVVPLQGRPLKSYVKKQYAQMKDALPETLTQPQQPVLAILHEYIFGPSKTAQSQPQQKEEQDAVEGACELTQKQRKSKDEDALKLFAAIKDGDFKKVQEVLTPFTINAKADKEENERTPLLQAIWLDKQDIAEFILNAGLTQQDSRLHCTLVQADLALTDANGNTPLKLAFIKDNYSLALAVAKRMAPEQRKAADQHKDPYLVYALARRQKENLADQDKKSLDELVALLQKK